MEEVEHVKPLDHRQLGISLRVQLISHPHIGEKVEQGDADLLPDHLRRMGTTCSPPQKVSVRVSFSTWMDIRRRASSSFAPLADLHQILALAPDGHPRQAAGVVHIHVEDLIPVIPLQPVRGGQVG